MPSGNFDWFQTLADVTRLRLLSILGHDEFSVGELCAIVQLPQSTVSRHLKLLAADGWIDHRRDRTNQRYSLSRPEWSESRHQLWDWVTRNQSDTATVAQDRARLAKIVSDRSRSEEFFNSAADQWDRLRVDLFGAQLDAFALAASLPSDTIFAELGCGSASLAQQVAPYVREVIAVDHSSAMLTAARARLGGVGNVRLIQASLAEIPIEDGYCDVAWLVLVLPYIEQPEYVLSEAARILKPNARLIVIDLLPHDRQAYRQEMGHVRLGIAEPEIDQWFERAGFRRGVYRPLPPDSTSKGPGLFVSVGHKKV